MRQPTIVASVVFMCAVALPFVLIPTCAGDPPVGAATADYPNHQLTPGADRSTDLQTIIDTESDTEHGRPSTSVKKQVFAEYGIPWSEHSNYEVDHFISIDLGGSNDITNLWPEHLDGPTGAKVKDRLEDKLGQMIRDGELSPTDAQHVIVTDWEAAYVKYVGPLPTTPM